MRKLDAVLMALAMALVWTAAFACDCTGAHPITPAIRNEDDVVFVGRVVAIHNRSAQTQTTDADGNVTFTTTFLDTQIDFQVERAWNGVTSPKISIAERYMSDCQFVFSEGNTYVVFAGARKDDLPLTDRCHRTKNVLGASDILKALGQATYSPPATQQDPHSRDQSTAPNPSLQRTPPG